MAGIQITGIFSGMNWSTIVTELITADSGPVTELQSQITANTAKINDLSGIGSDLTALQTAVEALGDYGTNVFTNRAATMVDSTSTWAPTASANTPTGNYAISVSTLASAAQLNGSTGVSAALATTSDVSGLTLATLHTATAPTAGVFTVDGQQVTVALTDSLQDVFDKISTATSGKVTGSYNPSTDEVSLASSDGSNVVLGAANDTSDMLQALKLTNSGSSTTTSASALGSVSATSPLVSAGLKGGFGSVDSSGNGTFTINGTSISYNVNTDTLNSIISKIDNSSANVTATYDSQADRLVVTNDVTGDLGVSAADTSGSLMASLGLTTGSALQRGTNATFTVNGGPARTSTTNSLTSAALGVSGLSLTVNSTGSESVNVAPDVAGMQTAINTFISAYNTLQADITSDTAITTNSDGTVTPSVLSGNYEVENWGENLRDLVFDSIPGLSGTIKTLDNMGIGFASMANVLSVTDQATLTNALTNNTSAVQAFFQSGSTGMISKLNGYLINTISDNLGITHDLQSSNDDMTSQISILQQRLDQEKSQLTAEFTAMEDAVESSQNQSTTLGSSFSLPSTNSTSSQTAANSSGNSSSSSSSSSSA